MKRTFVALAAGSALVLAGCSSGTDEPETFESAVSVRGNASQINANSESCRFAEGTVAAGTPIVVRGADDRILGKQNLEVVHMSDTRVGVCVFRATFSLEAGDAAYQISVDGLDESKLAPVILNESEMRGEPAVVLRNDIEYGLDLIKGG